MKQFFQQFVMEGEKRRKRKFTWISLSFKTPTKYPWFCRNCKWQKNPKHQYHIHIEVITFITTSQVYLASIFDNLHNRNPRTSNTISIGEVKMPRTSKYL